jgi:hypothetical protein
VFLAKCASLAAANYFQGSARSGDIHSTPYLIRSIVGASMLKAGILGLVHYDLDPQDLVRPRKLKRDRDGLSLEAGVILDSVHRCDSASVMMGDVYRTALVQ